MPRLSDDFVKSSIYLYPSAIDAQSGTKAGGSGFVIGVPIEGRAVLLYAVTNRHIIENGSCTVRVNTSDGKFAVLEFTELDWVFHPAGDDLAVCLLPGLDSTTIRVVHFEEKDHFITNAIVDELNVGVGDDVFVVGRFVNQEGKQRNTPTVRFGNIAQMPPEKISQQRGFTTFEQESFIVEAKSIGGYSGAPVFVGMNPTLQRPGRPGISSNRLLLLGIGWGYISDWEPVCDASGRPISNMKVKSNTGMMAVVPAWKLSELLHTPALVAIYDHWREYYMKQKADLIATPTDITVYAEDAANNSSREVAQDADNPDHKEDFMRLLNAAAQAKPEASKT
jgi:hypothetical protein